MKSIVERGARYLVKRYIRITRPYHSKIFKILRAVQVFSFVSALLPFILILLGNKILKETPMNKFNTVVLLQNKLNILQRIQGGLSIISSFMFNIPYLA